MSTLLRIRSHCAAVLGVAIGIVLLAWSWVVPAQTLLAQPKAVNAVHAAVAADAQGDTAQGSRWPERLVWRQMPLSIAFRVGDERTVTFPVPMRLAIDASNAPALRIQTIERTSYITALAPLRKVRVIAEDPASGRHIVLDVHALRESPAGGPVEIVFGDPPGSGVDMDAPHAGRGGHAGAEQESPDEVTEKELIQFAARQFYAPLRLAGPVSGIRRVGVNERPVPRLYRGAALEVLPLASWRSDDLYVTAVRLRNLSRAPIELQYDALRGQWHAATFQHSRLLSAGSDADTTVLYLISERPFEACQ